ncbi:hypothetical protein [Nocardia sp. NPDC059239]|uniref:hypothetical protein n=1 Tax=unclassified Nocardia TaxID=2637762 RepID=UPI0036BFED3E
MPDQTCPDPIFHRTHRYCPYCAWTEPPHTSELEQADDARAEAYIAGYLDATMSNCLDVVFGVFHVTPPEPVELPAEAVADAIAGMRREVPAAIEWARARLAKIAAATPKN